jgi:hypothetical protein
MGVVDDVPGASLSFLHVTNGIKIRGDSRSNYTQAHFGYGIVEVGIVLPRFFVVAVQPVHMRMNVTKGTQ